MEERKFKIITDSACDVPREVLTSWGIDYCCLTFRFQDSDEVFEDGSMPAKEYYDRIRAGGVSATAAVNPDAFEAKFREYLDQGYDILYVGFSSALSSTFNNGRIAISELEEEYPDRKLMAVDTLAASLGQGMILWHASRKQQAGASLEETAAYAEDIRLHVAHWFTVEDLEYLCRGGRVSRAAAAIGNVLGIKPIMHMADDGTLQPVGKVRGSNAAYRTLAKKLEDFRYKTADSPVFICESDCPEIVEKLSSILKNEYGVEVDLVAPIGSVIGAHTGPGTIGLFFTGESRNG